MQSTPFPYTWNDADHEALLGRQPITEGYKLVFAENTEISQKYVLKLCQRFCH